VSLVQRIGKLPLSAIHRLLSERYETVQPFLLLSPRPEHFNLHAKSEVTLDGI
jgi:hypothetical protein